MSLRLKRYAAYRDSGIPWLSAIPRHWDISRNGRLFTERSETGFPELPILEVSLRTGVRVRDFGSLDRKQMMSDLSHYKRAVKGDIAYNMMRMWQGAVGVAPTDGLVSPAYVVARPRSEVEPRYFAYLFRTQAYMDEVDKYSYGITKDRNRLYWDRFKQMSSPCPPLEEQRAIANFLDSYRAIVQTMIRRKRQMVEFLAEQKQAIVDRSLSRGLRSNSQMYPSGVEWVGSVPEKWTLRRLKFVSTINSGQVDPKDDLYREYVLIAPNHIEQRTGKLLYTESAVEQGADSGKYLVKSGQVIYSKIRPNLRKATIAREACLCSADMYALSANPSELRAEYLLYLLLSEAVTRYLIDCSMRVAMPKVNRCALGNCWLWYPPLDEQDGILGQIAREHKPIDQAIQRAHQEIELIREYQHNLVAHVVTGKLDVSKVDPTRFFPDRDGPVLMEEDGDDPVDAEGDADAE